MNSAITVGQVADTAAMVIGIVGFIVCVCIIGFVIYVMAQGFNGE